MRKTFLLALSVFLVSITVIGSDVYGFVFWPAIEVEIYVFDLAAIQKGDKVYMRGQVIGEVKKAELESSQKGIIKAKIYSDYKKLINESAVFTITADRMDNARQCLLVKNCVENQPAIKSGHQFQGYIGYRFETACIEKRAMAVWTEHYKKMVEDILDSTSRLSEETIDHLKVFGQEHHDEFIKWMDGLIEEMEDMAPAVRRQLDNLMKELNDSKDTAPDKEFEDPDSNSNQINT